MKPQKMTPLELANLKVEAARTEAEIVMLADEWEKTHAARASLCNDKAVALKPLQDELQAKAKPFDDAIAEVEAKETGITTQKGTKKALANEYRDNIVVAEVLARGSFSNVDEFRAFMRVVGIESDDDSLDMLPMVNGITIIRRYERSYGYSEGVKDSSYVAHYAVKGTDIVGFHITRKSEQWGDQASYKAWLGTAKFRNDNMLRLPLNEGDVVERVARFKPWKAKIERTIQSDFVPVDLEDTQTIEYLGSNY